MSNLIINDLYGHSSSPSIQHYVLRGRQMKNTTLVNNKLVLHEKRGAKKNSVGEYQFVFTEDVLEDLIKISFCYSVRIVLVCGGKRKCEFDLSQLLAVRDARRKSMGGVAEEQLAILVTIDNKNHFTAYANAGNKKGVKVGSFSKATGLFSKEVTSFFA